MSIEVYCLKACEVPGLDSAMIRRILPRRWARACRYSLERDRLLCLAAGHLMIRVLGISRENELEYNAEGKPFIKGGRQFNISHSGGLCVLAVSDRSIGVDLEKLDDGNLVSAPAVFTAEELLWIKPMPLERFHILWTRKESIYKAVGGYTDPRDIPALFTALPDGLGIKSMLLDGYALSVCSGETAGDITPRSII